MANALSHGFGILLILAFSPLLFLKAFKSEIDYLPLAVSLYILSLLMVFTFSTIYHATANFEAKRIFRKFDHISIFFLIGGTYLPVVLVHADLERAQVLLGIQWAIMAAGIINKIWFTGRFRVLSSIIYIGLGAMVLLMGEKFWTSLPDISIYLLVSGGLVYFFGVYFYQSTRWIYNHFVWHIFVLVAAILHFLAVYFSF
jgi:hemolysin III